MNPRIVAGSLGAITLVMGLGGLSSPATALDFGGLAPQNPTAPSLAFGEARAVYGGLFTVIGAFTLWGAIDPPGKRAALLMAAMLWLGLAVGRAIGASIDGNPGVMGWVALAWEAAFGTALLWSALARLPQAANAQVQ